MANIRDQNTWVHMNDPKAATEKAKDLVRMAVAKAALIEPLEQVMLPVTKGVLVVGGGVAGMEAALGVAEQGYKAYLVEKTAELGGVARKLRSTWKGEDIGSLCASADRSGQDPSLHPDFPRNRGERDFRHHRQLHDDPPFLRRERLCDG